MMRPTPYFRTNFRSNEKKEEAAPKPTAKTATMCYICGKQTLTNGCNHTRVLDGITANLCCSCYDKSYGLT